MAKPRAPEISTCQFSEEDPPVYRYLLDHAIDESVPSYARKTVVWVMANPSVANRTRLDRTLRRCRSFTQRLGGHHMAILNAFAFISQDPAGMLAAEDPVGPLNDATIERTVAREGVIAVIAGWGVLGTHRGRDKQLVEILRGRLSCLGLTKDGLPRHPLYLRADAPLLPFGLPAAPPDPAPVLPAPAPIAIPTVEPAPQVPGTQSALDTGSQPT